MAIERKSPEEMVVQNHHYCTFSSEVSDLITAHGNPDALCIWVYLINKPSSWVVRQSDVLSSFPKLSRRRYAEAIRVLKAVGVMKRVSTRSESGELSGSRAVVSNMIIAEQPNIPEPVPSVVSPNIPVTEHTNSRTVGERYDLTKDVVLTKDEDITKDGFKNMSEGSDELVLVGDQVPDKPARTVKYDANDKPIYDDDFMSIWPLFTNGGSKYKAYLNFVKINPNAELLSEMHVALARFALMYVEAEQAPNASLTIQKNGQGWFTARDWETEFKVRYQGGKPMSATQREAMARASVEISERKKTTHGRTAKNNDWIEGKSEEFLGTPALEARQ